MSKAAPKDDKTLYPESVKQKIIRIHPMGLLSLLMENNEIKINKGIIAGTRYVGGGYDAATNSFFIHLENDSFEETKLGDRLPDLRIEFGDIKNKDIKENGKQ